MDEPQAPSIQDSGHGTGHDTGHAAEGLLHAFGQLLVTVVESVSTRAELALIDLQEAVEMLLGLMVWAGIAVIAVGMTLFTGMLALLFIFWDTHRVLVAVLMVVLFALLAAWAGVAILLRLRAQHGLFKATLAELARDRERMRNRP